MKSVRWVSVNKTESTVGRFDKYSAEGEYIKNYTEEN